MTQDVLFATNDKGLGIITLNRPKALNSLSLSMVQPIRAQLQRWEEDERVQVILIRGAGEKGLCAGGDIKALYDARLSEDNKRIAEQFFQEEYELDQLIYDYPKPVLAYLDGIVMGGGVGLTYGAKYRIVTERTKWAMPEMNIGFFPDVGAAYFLNKTPGHLGRYLALTASVIRAEDVLAINGADYYMKSENFPLLLEKLEEIKWQNMLDVHATIEATIGEYAAQTEQESELLRLQEEIDRHFSYEQVEEIVTSLEKHPTEFTKRTKEQLLSKSPSSLKVTLKQLIEGEKETLAVCLATDFVLAKHFLDHHDFYEGVRSVVIDKDRTPNYQYKQLADFSDTDLARFFSKEDVIS